MRPPPKPILHAVALLAAFFFCAEPAAAQSPGSQSPAVDYQIALFGPAPASASLYSYADVFRLTVAGAAMSDFPLAAVPQAGALADSALRVGVPEEQAAGYAFSIRPVADRERWMLLVCGLAIALWVARRRLSNPL